MINFTCGCGKRLQVADEFTGRKVKCPGCGQVAIVPVNAAAAFVNQATAAVRTSASPSDAGNLPTCAVAANPDATIASAGSTPGADTGDRGLPASSQAQGGSELRSLGGYRVRLLGQGMGAAHEAEDVKLERRVA